ncbi:hypothetical protein NHX12_013035 [Muraenolepis orangiensis]|uniref:PDZ domain-containing protein n=1 Tax=Muraenolepis orangiensis TaxID=630683 RepID=A0A9Q0DD45_9TELE|nr:hypothetical protein NHX12_013035 [Muraenolepis orangiensis]
MSKTAVRKLHWHSRVKENFVPLVGSSGDLGLAVGGGADYAEFPFVTSAPGGGLAVGDVILEIGGTPVLGMTLGDALGQYVDRRSEYPMTRAVQRPEPRPRRCRCSCQSPSSGLGVYVARPW